ncbi:MAG: tetratricopeptide (TPR) repeat protein [Limisphaerales bacterium]|jgi:tetratricopeptide (TPR) repeat protein
MENTGGMTNQEIIGMVKIFGLVGLDIGVAAWLLYRKITMVEEDEFGFQVFRWTVAANALLAILWWLAPMMAMGGFVPIFALLGIVVCGLVMGACIAPSIIGPIAGLVTGNLDGSNEPQKPTPAYSTALAFRNRGEPQKSLAKIAEQLEEFPHDYEGMMLIAEIHAFDLRNLPRACEALEDLLDHGEFPPGRKSAILTTMADWELEIGKNTEGALRAFERIMELFPNTELARKAEQRILRLPTPQVMDGRAESRVHTLPSQRAAGDGEAAAKPGDPDPDPDPEAEARQLADYLIGRPEDEDARERLALLYAEHYKRVDLAADQLEHLISDPRQPRYLTVRRLNLLAQFYMRHALDGESARDCLLRIVDMFPGTFVAQLAEQDMNRVPDSATLRRKSEAVPMSTAEKDLGLKGKPVEWK